MTCSVLTCQRQLEKVGLIAARAIYRRVVAKHTGKFKVQTKLVKQWQTQWVQKLVATLSAQKLPESQCDEFQAPQG